MNELLNNPAVLSGLASAAGTLAALLAVAFSKLLHKLVLKTETKADDAVLAAIEEAFKKQAEA